MESASKSGKDINMHLRENRIPLLMIHIKSQPKIYIDSFPLRMVFSHIIVFLLALSNYIFFPLRIPDGIHDSSPLSLFRLFLQLITGL